MRSSCPTPHQLRLARRVLAAGGVIAYPTEAVWGLGCDPDRLEAVERVLALKGRAAAKGLILVASDIGQVLPRLAPLSAIERAQVEADWPGPVTWVLPAAADVSPLLTGGRDTLAVRVSAHPVVQGLCRAWGGPLVSTSANRSGRTPARSALDIRRIFGDSIDLIVPGRLGGRDRPTEIRDLSGRVLRS